MDDKGKNKLDLNLDELNNKSLRRYGDMYYTEGNYDLAFKCYEKVVNNCYKKITDRIAIYSTKCLAFMYYYGDGTTPKDYEKAKELYNYAIDKSDNSFHEYEKPEIRFLNSVFGENSYYYLENAVEDKRIEVLLEIGDFFYQRDLFQKAYEWYIQAAEQESGIAQLKIGRMFLEGKGFPKNFSESFDWFVKAANNEEPEAQFRLAKIYLYGDGRKKDYKKALTWIEKSVKNNFRKAEEYLPFIKTLSIPIMLAARENNINKVIELLNCNVDVNAKYEGNITVLMMAAFFDSIDVAKDLIARGADIIAKSSRSKTAFEYAVKHNSINYVRFMIDSGINIENKALLYAAKYNSLKVAKLAIENGADINIPDILLKAAGSRSGDVIKELLDSGARFGKTVLNKALDMSFKSWEYEGNFSMTMDLLVNELRRMDKPRRRNILSEKKKMFSAILEFHPRILEDFKYLSDFAGAVRVSLYYEIWGIETQEIPSSEIKNFSNYKELIQELFFYDDYKTTKLYKIRMELPGYEE